MANGKNLKAAAQGAPASTSTGTKSVQSIPSFFSRGRYINLKGRLNKAEREVAELKKSARLHTFRVKLLTYYHYEDGDTKKCRYVIDKEYKATSRAEAIGLAAIEMGHIMPNYSIAPVSAGGVQICTQIS